MNYLLIIIVVFYSTCFPQTMWEQTNGPTGNEVLQFATDDNGYIYCSGWMKLASNHGGIFRSTDNGNNWTNLGLNSDLINSIVVSKGNIFVAATRGIIRSTDGGNEWLQTSLSITANTIVTNSQGHIFVGTADAGVLRSTDNGETWTQINNGLDFRVVTKLAINSKGDIFLCGMKETFPWPIYYVCKSTDNGENWISIFNPYGLIYSLAINLNDDVFISIRSSGIYRSTDNGNHWSPKDNGINNGEIHTIEIDSSNHIYAGTEKGIFLSENNGENWINITNNIPNVSVRALEIRPSGDIYAGTYSGLFFSSDKGAKWEARNKGLGNTHSLSLIKATNGKIIWGTGGKGAFYSTDKGDSWIAANNGLGSTWILDFAKNSSDHIYAATHNGVFCSTNEGESWVSKGLNGLIIMSLAINSDGNIFASGYKSVFRSVDNGENWVEVSNGFTNRDVVSIAINTKGDIFAGATGDGVFRSTDNGDTWTKINNGITYPDGNALAINSHDDIFLAAYNDCYRSTDNGENWVKLSLTAPYVRAIEFDSSGNIFAGSGSRGVFYSTDNGDNWEGINDGLTYKGVNAVLVSNDYIYAGITYGGVFRRINSITSIGSEVVNPATSFSLKQNYPNPFNPGTTISFQIPKTSEVTLKVYDLLGKEIATLVNEEKMPGNYTINFDASSLSSGVYFYQLRAGEFIDTRKMILVK